MRVHQRSCVHAYHVRPQNAEQRSNNYLPRPHQREEFRSLCDKQAFDHKSIEDNWYKDVRRQTSDEAYELLRSIQDDSSHMLENNFEMPCFSTNTILQLAKLSRNSGRSSIDGTIKSLNNSDFSIEKFRAICHTVTDCVKMEDKFFSKNISQSGFQKLTVCDDMKQIYCDVYVRSPIRALQSQIRGSSSDSAFFNFKSHPENTRSFCHPMMAALGREGERTVRNEVMSCCEDRIMWHNDANSTEKSFAGMVQLYSDKSQTSLKESSFQFYPFHATLLNFSEEYRRQCIVNGMTTVAFLPTKFYSIENSCKTEINLARTSKLQILHRCITTILQELMESALAGFICVDLDGKARRCHSCIASYCCDIPESKDILPVRNGNSGERNCHRCTAETKDFYRYTNNVRRTGNSTLSLLLEAKRLRKLGNNKKAEEILKKHSLAEFVPSLLDFPFMGKHSVLDIHSIFGFEPLLNYIWGSRSY